MIRENSQSRSTLEMAEVIVEIDTSLSDQQR